MNVDRVISKINHDMNAFNESGGREDKACAEGLRRARTYVQQEVLKRKILTHDQQAVKWSDMPNRLNYQLLKSDAETLEDTRIVIMLLERVYYRELGVVGGESFITKQVDELLDAMNDIVEILEQEAEK